jgi:hypothetical protein
MKKLIYKGTAYISLLYALTLMLLSCPPNDDGINDCDCLRTEYTYTTITFIGSNGLPLVHQVREDLSTEVVPCQDEQEQTSLGNGNYFEITCE